MIISIKKALYIIAVIALPGISRASDIQSWTSIKSEVAIKDISIASYIEARSTIESILSYHSGFDVSYKLSRCHIGIGLREVFSANWARENRYTTFVSPFYNIGKFGFKARLLFEYSTFDLKCNRIRHRLRLTALYRCTPFSFGLSDEVFVIDGPNDLNRALASATISIDKISAEIFIGAEINFTTSKWFNIIGLSIVARC